MLNVVLLSSCVQAWQRSWVPRAKLSWSRCSGAARSCSSDVFMCKQQGCQLMVHAVQEVAGSCRCKRSGLKHQWCGCVGVGVRCAAVFLLFQAPSRLLLHGLHSRPVSALQGEHLRPSPTAGTLYVCVLCVPLRCRPLWSALQDCCCCMPLWL